MPTWEDYGLLIIQEEYHSMASNLQAALHGGAHLFVGGTMQYSNVASADPIFWMHHSNVDRLWFEWECKQVEEYSIGLGTVKIEPWGLDAEKTKVVWDTRKFHWVPPIETEETSDIIYNVVANWSSFSHPGTRYDEYKSEHTLQFDELFYNWMTQQLEQHKTNGSSWGEFNHHMYRPGSVWFDVLDFDEDALLHMFENMDLNKLRDPSLTFEDFKRVLNEWKGAEILSTI